MPFCQSRVTKIVLFPDIRCHFLPQFRCQAPLPDKTSVGNSEARFYLGYRANLADSPHVPWFELTFPKLNDVPPHVAKLDTSIQITLAIPFNLCLPEFGVRLRQNIIAASFVSVPKASVHENTSTILLQDNIGCTRQPFHIDAKTEAVCKEEFPYDYFWLGVLATDTGHAPMALFRSHFVCHGANLQRKCHIPKRNLHFKSKQNIFFFQRKLLLLSNEEKYRKRHIRIINALSKRKTCLRFKLFVINTINLGIYATIICILVPSNIFFVYLCRINN